MSLTVVNRLPAHVLFVHFVIVLVPLSALALVVCAASPAGARRLGHGIHAVQETLRRPTRPPRLPAVGPALVHRRLVAM
nr:hypothetical protein OG999_29485 [Streptomyces sp. NBC_00886]